MHISDGQNSSESLEFTRSPNRSESLQKKSLDSMVIKYSYKTNTLATLFQSNFHYSCQSNDLLGMNQQISSQLHTAEL